MNMTTINLYQEKQREGMLNDAGRISSSLIFFLVVFGILVAIFFGLKLATSTVVSKKTVIEAQISAENETFNGKKVDDVLDLQARLGEIKGTLTKVEVNNVLDKISKLVVPGVTFSSYSYTDKKILITLNAANFDGISKQIFNFKGADFVTSIGVENLSRGTKNIKCDIVMIVK